MSSAWPCVPLGEVLVKSDDLLDLVPTEQYKEVTIRLWGKGVVLRGVVAGSEIAAGRRVRIKTGQFILSRIDARNGALGVVPNELDGAVVSNDFPTYNPVESRLATDYLNWLSKTAQFVDLCRAASEGTTNRVRLQEDRFLAMHISLPSLSEQRRIVAKIEQLASKIEEARGLRDDSVLEGQALVRSTSRQAFPHIPDSEVVPLETVCADIVDCLHSNPVCADDGIPTLRSPDVGWGTLLLETARRTGTAEYIRRTRRGEPQAGDIILVREGGGTGKAGIVEDGQQVSLGQRVMQLRPDRQKVLPRFLLHQWLSPTIQENQIADRMKGSASPHLNIKVLRKFDFVLPPLPEQRRIVGYLDDLQAKVDQLKTLQAQTAAELDALLPSILDRAFRGELWAVGSSVATRAETTFPFRRELAASQGTCCFAAWSPRRLCGGSLPIATTLLASVGRCSGPDRPARTHPFFATTLLASVGRCSGPDRPARTHPFFAPTLLASVERCSRP